MRNFKIFVCIFIIFLIQTVILSSVHIFGAVPSAMIAFVMCVMLLENEFRSAVTISIICAVLMGTSGGRSFSVTVLLYVYLSVIVFALRKKPIYIGNFTKTLVWTFISSAIIEILIFAVREMNFETYILWLDALPTAVINTVIAAIVYPILKKTIYKEEKKKKLLIS